MIKETLNYVFEEKKQTDNNVGVIHIYRKNDNAWAGFIRYIKKDEKGKPFFKFYGSDLSDIIIDQQFQYELSYYSQELAKEWKKSGIDMIVKSDFEVEFHMEIDKGDGTPPKKVVV